MTPDELTQQVLKIAGEIGDPRERLAHMLGVCCELLAALGYADAVKVMIELTGDIKG